MQNLNKISKSILFLAITSFVLFTGSYLSKLLMISQFFDAETMELKPIFVNNDLTMALQTLLPIFTAVLTFYIAFLLFYILFIVMTKINLREYGWLFIITIILVVTTPFELYLIFKYDWIIIKQLLGMNFDSNYLIELIKNRIIALGPFPLVLLFSNFLVIFLSIFQPLQKVK